MKVSALYFDGTAMWVGTENGLYKINIDNPLAHWGAVSIIKKGKTSKSKRK